MAPRRAELELSGAAWGRVVLSGLGRGWACIGIQLNYSKTAHLAGGNARPSGAE